MGITKIHTMTECAIFAALLCIFSPITLPIGPIPVSMGIFAVMLTGIVLGWKKGAVSVLIYLLIGLCGLPLFSGGKSGFAAFMGPTGGYVWSYVLMVMVIWCSASGRSVQKSQLLFGLRKFVRGSLFMAWLRSGNFKGSRRKKTGVLFPTRSQLPVSV